MGIYAPADPGPDRERDGKRHEAKDLFAAEEKVLISGKLLKARVQAPWIPRRAHEIIRECRGCLLFLARSVARAPAQTLQREAHFADADGDQQHVQDGSAIRSAQARRLVGRRIPFASTWADVNCAAAKSPAIFTL
jgi:hypothetical protein